MKIVTVLGLGRMGSGIAHRLLDSGYRLQVFNRTASRAAALVAAGASSFATPREACVGAGCATSMPR